MARARKVELDCDGSFAEAAARVIEVRAGEVFAHADGVLDLSEVERVHDMRVATRRLRAALEVFRPCFSRKRHRKALKRLKALADALGERRDLDVEIGALQGFVDKVPESEREAIAALIEERRKRQREANEALAAYVAPKRLKKLHRRLARLVEKVKA